MRKIFGLLFLLFIYSLSFGFTFGYKNIDIISRSDWGANEKYRYIDSKYWQEIIEQENIQRKNNGEFISTQDTINTLYIPDYKPDIESYLEKYFSQNRKISEKITHENDRELFWAIEKSQKIQGLIIHHTATDYSNDYDAIKEIYKFHTLNNRWGDIGYNFIIGKNGDIFEGRAGGETAIGAHDKWNNIGNIGIALIGNYDEEEFTQKQKESLEKLSKYLIEKYKINLNKKEYYHTVCIEEYCRHPLESELMFPFVGHRDAGHTTCPGEEGYKYVLELRNQLQEDLIIYTIPTQKFEKLFDTLSRSTLIKISERLEDIIKTEQNIQKKELLLEIEQYLEYYLQNKRGYLQ